MSYDFTPTHHIGYTAQGYLIGSLKRKKPAPKPISTSPYSKHSDGALRLECAKGNQEAIAEFEFRLRNGGRV